jgi:hypothetical protein
MKLLNLNPEGIQKLLDGMEKDCESIKETALTFSWYLRGGASYQDILNMSYSERLAIKALVDKNLETTKTTKLPFF